MKNAIRFLICSCILASTIVDSASKNELRQAQNLLKKSWSYYSSSGKKITIRQMGYQCRGGNCELKLNGKTVPLSDIYILKGNKVTQILTGKVVKTLTDEELLKNGEAPISAQGNEPGELKGITEAHNRYRRKLNLPDLKWRNDIAAYAQIWANHLQKTNNCKMKHRKGRYKIKKYGENLAWSSGMRLNPWRVVEMWYNEVKDYDYASNSCRAVCGHYTQVVWKTSLFVGCALARCSNSEVWVCNYDPPGNYVGQRPY